MNRATRNWSAIGLGLWAGIASALPTQWTVDSGGNGHWYELSDHRLDWQQGRADAASRSHQGLPGYLATLTSAAEAAFVGELRNASGNGSGWLSGSDAAVEGDWRWMDGPEAGRLFWRGGSDGTAVGYASWGSSWPNGEDFLASNYGSWGSYDMARGGGGEFFYVEYSAAVPEPPAIALLLAGLVGLAARRRLIGRGRGWAAATVLALAGAAPQAALHDRGNGLIYDDVLDLTWLQDSNFSALQQPQDQGYMSYWQAKDFVSSLGIELADGRIAAHWRLPQFRPVNGLMLDTQVSNDGSTDVAYNIGAPGSAHAGTTASELAYMFHINLGNKSYCDVNGLCPQPGWGLLNRGPFINFDTAFPGSGQLWAEPADMPLPPDADMAWSYQIQYGAQSLELDAFSGRARVWAVHDGDIAAVPEPGVWVLMLSGLAWVAGGARRRTPRELHPA